LARSTKRGVCASRAACITRTCTNGFGLRTGFGEAALLGFESALLLGECRVEVRPGGGLLRMARSHRRTLRLRNGLRAWAGGRRRSRRTAVGRMHDGAALAFGDFALDLFADLSGSLGACTSRTFFVVEFGLRPGLPPLAFVFARRFLLFARVQPIGEGSRHSDDELEVVENPVHKRKG